MVTEAVSSVLSLLLLIAVGFYITGKPWFKEHGSDIFSKYSVRVAIPCYMVYNVVTTCEDTGKLLDLVKNIPIPFLTILLSALFGFLLAKVFHISPQRRGVFINAIAFSNTVIIGFPVITALFGDKATADGMIYYMANTILFWTLGTYLLRQDAGEKGRLISLDNLKKVLSPPLTGFLIGVVLVVTGISLPDFIFSPLSMIKSTTTPIAMIFIGSIIRKTDFKKVQFTKDLLVVLLVRLLFSPVFMAAICMLLPVDTQMKRVFFILATMPAMTQLGIMAKESNSDYEFASILITLTTTISMVALPIYSFILVQFNLFG
ncbi:MAG: AEC family transporter [Provencibacterium sp.]|jgi:predicted permease|nr:AEC family transporter [Provencibacterium sp.]